MAFVVLGYRQGFTDGHIALLGFVAASFTAFSTNHVGGFMGALLV